MRQRMSGERWADITEAGYSSDGERGQDGESGRGRSRGGERAARTERAAQRLVRAAAAALVPLGRVRAGAGVIAAATLADAGPEAGNMAGLPGGFAELMLAYHGYMDLDAALRGPFCKERATFKTPTGVPPFALGPGDLTVFNVMYEVIRKLNHILLVGRFSAPRRS